MAVRCAVALGHWREGRGEGGRENRRGDFAGDIKGGMISLTQMLILYFYIQEEVVVHCHYTN